MGPRRPRRFKPQALAGHMEQLRALVAAQPALTVAEIRHALGVSCSVVSVWRAVRRLGVTGKKKSCTRRNRRGLRCSLPASSGGRNSRPGRRPG